MLRYIERTLALCHAAQFTARDPVVAAEIEALQTLSNAVGKQWPLDRSIKEQIHVGPVAARNIADWDAELANALMKLDYALRHDGAGIMDEDENLAHPNSNDVLAA